MTHAIRRNPNASRYVFAPIVCAVALYGFAFHAFAQVPQMMVSFQDFYKNAGNARFEDYANKAGVKVRSPEEFQKMKAHVISMYEGVKVKHSFVLGERDFIDCVDMRTQPGLRKAGKFVAPEKPPAPMVAKEKKGDEARKGQQVAPMLSAQKKDRFGNAQYCEKGFVPMRRVTLDEMVRYETLGDFFNKYGKAGEKGLPERQ